LLFYRRNMNAWLRLGIEFSQEVVLPAHPGWKGPGPVRRLGLMVETRGPPDQADWIQILLLEGREFARWTNIYNVESGDRSWKNDFTMVGLEGKADSAPWAERLLDQRMYQGLNLKPRELRVNLELVFDQLRELLKDSFSYVSPVRGQPLMDRKVGPSPVRVGKHGEQTLKLLS